MTPVGLTMADGVMLVAQARQPVTLVGRPVVPASEGHPFLVPSILASLCVAGLGVILIRAWRRRSGAPGRRGLVLLSRAAGLRAAERALVDAIGGHEPLAVMVSEHAFVAAVERWVRTGPSESDRLVLRSLAGRLGWAVPELPPLPVVETAVRRSARPAAITKAPTVRRPRLVA